VLPSIPHLCYSIVSSVLPNDEPIFDSDTLSEIPLQHYIFGFVGIIMVRTAAAECSPRLQQCGDRSCRKSACLGDNRGRNIWEVFFLPNGSRYWFGSHCKKSLSNELGQPRSWEPVLVGYCSRLL
jgi:hypothetical protein